MTKLLLQYSLALCAFAVLSSCVEENEPNNRTWIERDGIRFEALSDTVWMHTSFSELPRFGAFPSNGLIVLTGDTSLLVDTAWTVEQTDIILNFAEDDLGHPVDTAIFTHAHSDKMGGIDALHARDVVTFAHPKTNAIAPRYNLTAAKRLAKFSDDDLYQPFEGVTAFYPGPGHTDDNIVVYIRDGDVLFGGCMIRPSLTTSLGNTLDADIGRWDSSVQAVVDQFPYARLIVPSHGPPGPRDMLQGTISLVQDHRNAAEAP